MKQYINTFVKLNAIRFLQAVIVLLAFAVLIFMLWEPHLEGRNAHAELFEIYFMDPFLAFAYIGSVPFFAALYQAFKVLGYTSKNNVFSQEVIKALQTIKYCALLIIGFVSVGEIIIFFNSSDDRAGGVVVGLLVAFGSVIMAAAAGFIEQIIQTGMARIDNT